VEIASFTGMVKNVAALHNLHAELPNEGVALSRAGELDAFCADVDVMIGMNLVAPVGSNLTGTKIRGLAESQGMTLKGDGSFHFPAPDGSTLFALTNMEPRPFQSHSLANQTTRGLTFLLDVPKVARDSRALDQMITVARRLAGSLEATLVDDNRAPLSDTGVAKIRQQLDQIYQRMDARGIPAGSPLARRLFSG
jgi:FtsZ-interacting cell division protein ZipA